MPTYIYKYELSDGPTTELDMPADAVILDYQIQNGSHVIWASVDSSEPTKKRRIMITGTGYEIPKRHVFEYIGTVQDGPFVWHALEILRERWEPRLNRAT